MYQKLTKTFILLSLFSLFGVGAMAQDIIVKKNGSEIEVKVLEITDIQIKYKDFDFQEGPVRNISISEVLMIIYQNGKREVFNKPAESTSQNNRRSNSESQEENEQSNIFSCGLWVACADAPSMMTWDEARQNAPHGYRLPTPDELKCIRNGLKPTKGRLLAREYWTSEDALHNKAYTVTMDDGKEEKNKRSDKFFVRYVMGGGYEDVANGTQQMQTESYSDISNNKTTIDNEYVNNKGFVMSKKAEIIVDSYALMDGAGACNYIIKNLEELGFCCVSREEFKNNNSATISIAVANGFPASVRIIVMDRTKDVEVWNTTYTNWSFGYKFLKKFIKDMKPFICE